MKHRQTPFLPFLIATVLLSTSRIQARDLSFQERVRAQEAIERVYYSHQIGAKRPFEQAVPRSLVEEKVRTYLKQSAALEAIWRTPLTAEALQREIDRIARSTRAPARLEEIRRALGQDELVIQECFARPALVNRLARSFLRSDARFQGAARARAEALRGRLLRDPRAGLGPGAEPRATEVRVELEQDSGATRGEAPRHGWDIEDGVQRWRVPRDDFDRLRARAPRKAGEVGAVIETEEAFEVYVLLEASQDSFRMAVHRVGKMSWDDWWADARHRFNELAVGAVAQPAKSLSTRPSPARLATAPDCVPDDTWDGTGLDDSGTATSTGYRPANSSGHTAVWTGNEMIVWGGGTFGAFLGTGAAFDPITASWTAVSTLNAPAARSGHVAVWTGSRMVIWGGAAGEDNRGTGGRYDPIADSWSPTSLSGPSWRLYRAGATAVWTGTSMIVWGGVDTGEIYVNSGSRYDPESDLWQPVSPIGAPQARAYHTAVWTGDAMLVWGGFVRPSGGPDTWLGDGYAYHPATDSWTPLSGAGAPSPRENHSAVWTGETMLVWGGNGPTAPYYLTDGAAYDAGQDTWEAIPSSGAPAQIQFHSAVWTGTEMIVWGSTGFPSVGVGGRYDAATKTWRSVSQEGAPFLQNIYGQILAPVAHTAVWTGDEMIVWGGGTNTGSAYRIDLSPDADADGFTVCAGDCDDTNAAIHPGATETCDGQDDDCDGQVDEGFDVGAACTQDIDACHQIVGALACAADGTRSVCVGPITFVDTTPPTITAGAFPPTLWPPNHRMVDVTESVVASDLCSVPTVTLTSIRSLEPDDAPGEQDGETTGDIQGADIGTADFAFQLRDERSGDGPGRAYEVTYQAVDGSGNASSVTSIVFVPHDRGGATEPIHLSVDDSGDGTSLRWDAVSGALSYRAIRGRLENLRNASDFIDLGTVACVQPSSAATDTQGHADPDSPAIGEAFFYLVAYNDGQDSGFGTESAPKPEIVTGGGCP